MNQPAIFQPVSIFSTTSYSGRKFSFIRGDHSTQRQNKKTVLQILQFQVVAMLKRLTGLTLALSKSQPQFFKLFPWLFLLTHDLIAQNYSIIISERFLESMKYRKLLFLDTPLVTRVVLHFKYLSTLLTPVFQADFPYKCTVIVYMHMYIHIYTHEYLYIYMTVHIILFGL